MIFYTITVRLLYSVYVTLSALRYSALFSTKSVCKILMPTTPIAKKKIQGIVPTPNFSALIFLVRQKWVGVNIFGNSALIFLALVTGHLFLLEICWSFFFQLWLNVKIYINVCIFESMDYFCQLFLFFYIETTFNAWNLRMLRTL
jgi:hypothetical protein